MWTLIFSSFLLFSISAFSQSFSSGNNFDSQRLNGYVRVHCYGSPEQPFFASYQCSMEILNPRESDYFIGPAGINANKVELTATREDGSTRKKDEKYDSEKGRSKGSFNLWISTLTQKPLLKMGNNRIDYNMIKDGSNVAKGSFNVNVKRVPGATCRDQTYTSNNPNDCRFGDQVCGIYFRDQNYCQ